MKVRHKNYNELISFENIFLAWQEFKKGKMSKGEVLNFARQLEDNLFDLHEKLKTKKYCHGKYHAFAIWDPKHRIINKASVRDRVVHHLVFKELYKIFDRSFTFHSYSSRLSKGTHLGVQNLGKALRKQSRNYSKRTFVLKCDIKKFFDTIDHEKLLDLVKHKVKDPDFLWLIEHIIRSFCKTPGQGLPIGNITSQIFANIYLNELDQFIKRKLRVKCYFRYADDFIIVSRDRQYLLELLKTMEDFLQNELALKMHPGKVELCKFRQGVDFLGYVVLPHYVVLRTKTKKRMFSKLKQKHDLFVGGEIDWEKFNQTLQSYNGLLKHSKGHLEYFELLRQLELAKFSYFRQFGLDFFI